MNKTALRALSAALSALIAISITGCQKRQPLELGVVDPNEANIVVGVIAEPGAYSVDGATGLYGNTNIGNLKISFLGICDYSPANADETRKITEGYKALVAAISVETTASNSEESISESNFRLVDCDASTLYDVAWNLDESIDIEDEKIAGTVECYRFIFIVPEATTIDNCILLLNHNELDEPCRYAMSVPTEDISGTTIDYINMCPLCEELEYQYDQLNVSACAICGRKFVSGHSPCQKICFSCSVINNYCTQCMRFIEKNNATIIKKK